MGKITKTLSNYDVLNILAWTEVENGFWATTKLPIKLQWDMKKNTDVLNRIKTSFEEFQKKIQEKYSDDKYSEDKEQDGQVVRVVKDKYIEEYNKEITELLFAENEVEIIKFDIEDFGDISLEKRDMDMLSFFIDIPNEDSDNNVEAEKVDGEVVG